VDIVQYIANPVILSSLRPESMSNAADGDQRETKNTKLGLILYNPVPSSQFLLDLQVNYLKFKLQKDARPKQIRPVIGSA
jgi:hypothetical protein